MSEPSTVETATTAHQGGAAVLDPTHAVDIYLGPGDGFPSELAGLSLLEVQVLHSRLNRQLEWEYCHSPQGPHAVTQDRHQELVAELETRAADLPQPGALG